MKQQVTPGEGLTTARGRAHDAVQRQGRDVTNRMIRGVPYGVGSGAAASWSSGTSTGRMYVYDATTVEQS
ncbi:hypothetical protein GCM10009647_071870 [Streptomyces sanglieri]